MKRTLNIVHVDKTPFFNYDLTEGAEFPVFGCKAAVIDCGTSDGWKHYAVRSYWTIVAYIHVSDNSDVMVVDDVLRTTYGYTKTSVQHIRKAEEVVRRLSGYGSPSVQVRRYVWKP